MANTMKYKEFQAQIMEAPRLVGDYVHRLPPGSALEVYPMDAFLKVPENWMRGQGVFVVPVRPNRGLWFNWRMNSEANTAIIPTVKGCNPITGLQTSGFHLEKYENKCPKHNVDFMADRFCPKCNYKWMPQNYVTAPNLLWWDTWNTGDGIGRQFFFSEEELRDIATAMLGKENTVPAFGFAFYSPKERRPEITHSSRYGLHLVGGQSLGIMDQEYGSVIGESSDGGALWMNALNTQLGNNPQGAATVYYTNSSSVTDGVKCSVTPTAAGAENYCSSDIQIKSAAQSHLHAAPQLQHLSKSSSSLKGIVRSKKSARISTKSFSFVPDSAICDDLDHESIPVAASAVEVQERRESKREVKEVSIGAGSQIDQGLIADPYPLDSWKDVPDAVMTIYFVFQEKFEELKAGGMRDFSGVKEGMLQGLPVG